MKISFNKRNNVELLHLADAELASVYVDGTDPDDKSVYLCIDDINSDKGMVDLSTGHLYDKTSFASEGARWLEVPAELFIGGNHADR